MVVSTCPICHKSEEIKLVWYASIGLGNDIVQTHVECRGRVVKTEALAKQKRNGIAMTKVDNRFSFLRHMMEAR